LIIWYLAAPRNNNNQTAKIGKLFTARSLVFQLDDLAILRKALHFLQSDTQSQESREDRQRHGQEDTLILGHFGSDPVSLRRDNEDFIRYFLVVGFRANSTLHVSLFAEDIQKIIEALCQVVEDIPAGVGEK
jgi:hypothetical protein